MSAFDCSLLDNCSSTRKASVHGRITIPDRFANVFDLYFLALNIKIRFQVDKCNYT